MHLLTATDVGKKKAAKAARPREAEEEARKPSIMQVRGSAEYKRWVESLVRFDDRPLSSIIERALREYAAKIGFKEEQPDR